MSGSRRSTTTPVSHRSPVPWVTGLAVVTVAVVLAAILGLRSGRSGGSDDVTAGARGAASSALPATASSGAAEPRAAAPSTTTVPEPTGPQPLPVSTLRPVRLEIPRLGIASNLDALRIGTNNGLQAPPRWNVAGWYTGGAVPGELGPAVIAGHVDSPSGPAVFWRLRELVPGDAISVRLSDSTTARFRVIRVEQHPRDAFPSAEVYGPTPDRALRLITCAGVYDKAAGGYRDNRIVFARAV